MKKRTWFFTFLLISTLLICGCGSDTAVSSTEDDLLDNIENEIEQEIDSIDELDSEDWDHNNTVEVENMQVDDTQQFNQSQNLVDPYGELVDLSDRMASGHMRVDDIGELCDFINEQVSVGNLEMSFEYSPGAEGLDPTQLAWISSKMSISYYEDAENPNVLYMTVYLYPGDEIANAYLTGDTSALNTDEMQVLDIASEVVEDA